ncbi:MAG TPA: DUF6328 family protein [Terriglobales bacterium]|nr:DUF6328 family protein [Terriglobales bacterium]
MAKLADKVENALNEARILLLGGQVLIGFYFRAFFETGFPRLTPLAQHLEVASLGVMLLALGLLIWPAAYHRIIEGGNITVALHRATSAALAIALLPFMASVASFGYLACMRAGLPQPASTTIGVALGLLCLYCWYGLEPAVRRKNSKASGPHALLHPGGHQMPNPQEEHQASGLTNRIKQVLIECRMVLPGAQALLGFQFITVFMQRFDDLPQSLKELHIASLLLVAICTVLLITPAAYHRIVEGGEDSERFHAFASHMLLASMVFLALGVSGDFLLILLVALSSSTLAAALAAALLAFFMLLWFGSTSWIRARRNAALS